MSDQITIGFPNMHVETGERRAYLPEYISRLERLGARVALETGYGARMGFSHEDYQEAAPQIKFVSHKEAYQQDYVFVLRCPADEDLQLLQPGACLISMLHYPTRPTRTEFIRSLGVEAISLDALADDHGRRLVENLRAVAWNGIEVAFRTLRTLYPSPGFDSPHRDPIRVAVIGIGKVGMHAVQAATRYGDTNLWHELINRKTPGVQVTAFDFDTTNIQEIMLKILAETDILVDSTKRPDPSKPVIPNDWVAVMPKHAILLDLSVDPYKCDQPPIVVKAIEGTPQGSLDQFVFAPDDPIYDDIPACISTEHRRYAVSCYSWPGIHPQRCMQVYGKQLNPIFRILIEKGSPENIDARGRFFERAISRAMLSRWKNG